MVGRPVKFNDKQKWCPKCETWLDHKYFGAKTSSASGLDDLCKPCKTEYNRPYKVTWRRKHLYGISNETFKKLWDEQKGLCAVCERPLLFKSTRKAKTCIDHNHVTKQVRGLLCDSCNRGLGFFFDSLELLQKAIEYLKKYTTEP